ncbi:MAG: 1-(5-phosphoribosyl)-5-[(5-phosphoribosylamino)methylideneamino]imidazole-4-carboxamide isomerase [Planctomycetales bacterium]|nr:1-(5-phosphoribosyl)-5-[(5-phosphoribosylamino)methylideneamino]imidazole-4-carboxamide isomerase [Planctomycetales bacterium]NIM09764.1 1-(5-phosphoribosyl)-5-[(5-phosphoribosylamino)methylideneamino]imidazole-4-carboxamide isomerase [Planctomycetales bacterium]NIN09233.1 1-(5-phosphoribosyl)-5-[(5-phosphoribosylamino)methylideneamino]imidazole-4-carboxamide isomerase [Planctomycetales bacterium]NIN78333.1 1-(5-phosphoribosyl)-5-[(5-phosphoribosylamino)methylideneamino]imidazole-4-carboxamid
MQIWAAIDLRNGHCVRLWQGDYQQETIYDDDPAAVAARWVREGARFLHLVDLDGARQGRLINVEAVQKIVATVDVPCELGGGIRDQKTVDQLLEMGLSRLIVGTRALQQPDWFRQMARRYPHKLVLGVDARQGYVATEGWLETSQLPATELARQFNDEPLAAVIYTDIATDGTLTGPNVSAVGQLREAIDLPVIASGGVGCAEDVARLAATGVTGCIIGKALYEGKLTMAEALAAASVAEV